MDASGASEHKTDLEDPGTMRSSLHETTFLKFI